MRFSNQERKITMALVLQTTVLWTLALNIIVVVTGEIQLTTPISASDRKLGVVKSMKPQQTIDSCLSNTQWCAYFDMSTDLSTNFNITTAATNFCPPTPEVSPVDDQVRCVHLDEYCSASFGCNSFSIFPLCCEQCYDTIVTSCLEGNNWCNSCTPVAERCSLYTEFAQYDLSTSSPDYVFRRFELFRETLCIPLNDVPFACGDEDTARNFCAGYTSDFSCVNDCPDGCKDDDCPKGCVHVCTDDCVDKCLSVVINDFFCPCSR